MKPVLVILLLLASCLIPSVIAQDLATLQAQLDDLRARVERLEEKSPAPLDPAVPPPTPTLSPLAVVGETKFNAFCTACHKDTFSHPMLAPQITMVQQHYGDRFGTDRPAYIEAVVGWIKAPTIEKSLMPGAIRNFNLMPAFPLPDEDLTAIATFLFESYDPQASNASHGPGPSTGRRQGQGPPSNAGPRGPTALTPPATPPPQPTGTNVSLVAIRGRSTYETYCMACHKADRAPPMVAPPIFAIADHYKKAFPTDRDAFAKAILDWTKQPAEAKSLMPGAIQQFKMMPPFPIPDSDILDVAAFMFETDFSIPDWYDAHFQAEHGAVPVP